MPKNKHADFIRLFAPLQSQLLGYLRSLTPSFNDADDILQEVAVTAWDKFDDFDLAKGAFKSWLFGIARYKSMHAKRRYLRSENLLSEAQARQAENYFANIDNDYLQDRQEALRDCLNELSTEQRNILLKRYRDKQKSHEIADVLQRSAEQVRIQLFRLRKILKICISQKVQS
ncbi:MAG: sigma-70 family RNA polymerase sigma factor [Lentisphaeraceae bacterium]|nr:sigma-70 family RNA polymerase sigma factor [Lentisphaeraceae bacterium]